MEKESLGPCPLCGGEEVLYLPFNQIQCQSLKCNLPPLYRESWQTLSALAEQNRRRGEALANAIPFIEFAGEEVEYAVGEAGIARILKLCKEALK